jgi:hypothetical protein
LKPTKDTAVARPPTIRNRTASPTTRRTVVPRVDGVLTDQGYPRSVPDVATTTYPCRAPLGHDGAVTDRTPQDWPLLAKTIFVSRRSHEQEVRPGFVYRENPDNARDSGWRALVGDETAAEVDDPANALLQEVGDLLARWPELRPVLETDPAHGSWAWDADAARYLPLPEQE